MCFDGENQWHALKGCKLSGWLQLSTEQDDFVSEKSTSLTEKYSKQSANAFSLGETEFIHEAVVYMLSSCTKGG